MACISRCLLILAAAPLALRAEPPYAWAQVQVGHLSQENSVCVKDSQAFGAGAGRWTAHPRWGWEVGFLHSRLTREGDLWKAKEDHLDASVLFRPWLNPGRWVPFLRAGAGASRLESPLSLAGTAATRLNLVGGAGVQILLGSRALGTLEVRRVTVATSTRRLEMQILAGLGGRWGAPQPAPATPLGEPIPPPPQPVAATTPGVAAPVIQPAPAPEPVPAPPAAQPAQGPLCEAVLHFPNNGDALGPADREVLLAVAKALHAYPGEYLLGVAGHASRLGTHAHNQALALRRAQAAAKVLVEAGIPASRLTVASFGPDRPVADNRTRQGQSLNRRVEVEVRTPAPVDKVRSETNPVP